MEQYENRIGKAPSRPIEPIIETAPPIILFLIICAIPVGIHYDAEQGKRQSMAFAMQPLEQAEDLQTLVVLC